MRQFKRDLSNANDVKTNCYFEQFDFPSSALRVFPITDVAIVCTGHGRLYQLAKFLILDLAETITLLLLFFQLLQKNSVPEAMVPGLCVVKEDNKVVLQIPNSGQTAVCWVTSIKSRTGFLLKMLCFFMRLWLAFTRLFVLDIFCSLNLFSLVLISLSYSTIAEKKGPNTKINCNLSNFGDPGAT